VGVIRKTWGKHVFLGEKGCCLGKSVLTLADCVKWEEKKLFESHQEQARAETGGADQFVLKRREFPGLAIVNEKIARIPGIPTISFQ